VRRLHAETKQRSYEVLVGEGLLADLGSEVTRATQARQVVVVSDENVAPLYLDLATGSLAGAGLAVSHVILPAGEQQKSLERVYELYGVLYERGLRRGDALVALGGGVIGDLTGFVAATYQRGVGFVQVPTTLLAQVDAAVGGKTGVDFRAGKNYVGAFYQPHVVVADLATLASLPARELRNGYAEVIKYAFLQGGELLDQVERVLAGAGHPTEEVVAHCVAVKIGVVQVDEREESGQRALLNLGHTIGHAIEVAGGYAEYSHGEAVGLGLRAALWLSHRLCGLSADEEERGQRLLTAAGLPERLAGVDAAAVATLIARDKKADAAGVRYVLLSGFGQPLLGCTVAAEVERAAVQWLMTR